MSATRSRKASTRWQTSATPEQKEAYAAKKREAGKAKAQAALDRLDAAIERIAESDEAFAEYLRISGKMHGYSFGNRLLIWMQRPDAGMVAGFHKWIELGRPVKKGSKGIQILAPMVVKKKDEQTGELDETRCVGFRVAYVFSVHDTDGAPFSRPSPVMVEDDSDRAQALAKALLLQARAVCPVSFEQIQGTAHGYYHPYERRIAIREGMPAGQTAKTLIHELAHFYAHENDPSYADGEILAESVAFVVASHYGLDTSGYSAPYVATWARGDVKRFRSLLDRIMRVSADLINGGEVCPSCMGEGCEECR